MTPLDRIINELQRGKGVEDAKRGLQRGQAFNISTVHHFVPPLKPKHQAQQALV